MAAILKFCFGTLTQRCLDLKLNRMIDWLLAFEIGVPPFARFVHALIQNILISGL